MPLIRAPQLEIPPDPGPYRNPFEAGTTDIRQALPDAEGVGPQYTLSPERQAALYENLKSLAPGGNPDPVAQARAEAVLSVSPFDPIEQQHKAVQAAIMFQGRRGYDKDLQSGMPADQALAKWGPMLFADKPQEMVKMAPWTFTPGQGGQPSTFQKPGERPIIVKPPAERTETVTEVYPKKEAQEGSPAEPGSRGPFGIPLPFGIGSRPAIPAVPAVPERPERRITRKVPVGTSTGTAKPRNRVERANELRREHPDWSKDKIIQQVYEEFK